MKGKAIAAALAVFTVFSAGPVASARHQAEAYAERVQRERRERLREAENEAELRAQAAARRRAAEERRSAEEKQRQVETKMGDDEDASNEDDELIRWEKVRGEEQAKADAAEEKTRVEEETQRAAEESARDPKEALQDQERQTAEATERDKEQSEADTGEKAGAMAKTVAEEAADTGEGLLAKYMRIARERLQGGKPLPTQAVAQTAPGPHIAEPQPMKRLAVETTDAEGTLLFSDSPEYVKEPGILYSDIVKDDARIFYYHLNDTKKPYKVAVVLEGESERSAVVSLTRRAIAEPSTDYSKVGKSLQQAYFADAGGAEKIVVAPHERRLLLEAADKIKLMPGELVSGMADFSADAPVRVSVLFYPPDRNPLQYISEVEQLPADEHHLRGTFIGMNRILRLKSPYHPKKDGIGCVVLADGEIDPYREGVDATDGSIVTNVGNYGVVYRLEMPVKGKTRFMMSPMGGGYAGVVRAELGKEGARLISVPDGMLMFGEASYHPPFNRDDTTTLLPSAELADFGIYKKKPSPFFEFSPPGASNLPILLILAPEKTMLAGEGGKKAS